MIDMTRIKYQLLLVLPDGTNLDLTDVVETLNWEEGKNELAIRISCTFYNTLYNGSVISTTVKPGCLVGILADWGTGFEEVARGTVTDWEPNFQSSKSELSITCYDDLYYLQKSQDNVFFAAGIDTYSAISQIFESWDIPLEGYEGPKETHAKLVYKSKAISEMILDILDDAAKKGAEKCIIRNVKGAFYIIPKGSNQPIYHFGEDNTTVSTFKLGTGSLVTRVKVIGQEDEEGHAPVEAVLDGKTEYGIRQKIVVRGKDDSLDEAKSSAQEILNEDGEISETIRIEAPDVPVIRKGDVVHIAAGALAGYYFVEGIRHNASSGTMSMDIEKSDAE